MNKQTITDIDISLTRWICIIIKVYVASLLAGLLITVLVGIAIAICSGVLVVLGAMIGLG